MSNKLKQILGFEHYFISKDGNVYSNLERYGVYLRNEKRVQLKYRIGKIHKLKLYINKKSGYSYVGLSKNGKVSVKTIHRLVALAFIENILNKPFVCHKDGNPRNNNADNLYWGTRSENMFDAVKHGTHTDNRGEKNGQSKLKLKDVLQILEMSKIRKIKTTEILKLFPVKRVAINSIIRGVSWRHANLQFIRNIK